MLTASPTVHTPLARWQALRAESARFGWRTVLLHRAQVLLERHLGCYAYRVYRRPFLPGPAAPLHPTAAALPGVTFGLLDAPELRRWAADPRYDITPEFLADALARGDLCTGAVQNGRLLGYLWWSAQATHDRGRLWAAPGAGDCYCYKGFVLPEARGHGLYEALTLSSGDDFLARGFTHMSYFVSAHNAASLRAQAHLGPAQEGLVLFADVAGRTLRWRSPGARRVRLRFLNR